MSPPQKNPQNPQTTPLLCKSYLADEHPWILRGIHEEQSRWLRRFPEIQVIPLDMAKEEQEGQGGTGWRRCPWNESWGDEQPPLCTNPIWKGFPGGQGLGKLQSGIQTQLLPFFQAFPSL